MPPVRADALGPLVELRHVALLSGATRWFDSGRYSSLLRALESGGKWFDPSNGKGFVSVAATESDYEHWTEFQMRAKLAATNAGFASDEAGQFVAAMGELRSNIIEHSERKNTGYLAYDTRPKRFEFVVADAGIGVLQSLRSHSHFSSVGDAGTALRLALSEGVSRHYDDKDRGKGFRPIFVGLANASRHLRFRSGDHSREIERKSDGTLPATTRQLSQLRGFLSSVTCET